MTIKSSKIKIILAFMALFLIQFAVLAPVSADLTEVETNKQGLNKTEPTDGSGGEPVDGADESLPWWKKALNKLDDIGDGLIDGWNKFKDWAVDEWNDAWDTAVKFGKDVWGDIEAFFAAIGDWFSENKWAQTLLGGILAAAIIIGVIALLVFFGVIAIPIGIVGGLIILAGALIGGFLYQWLAGDNYSFWGAFGFSLVGGILGYIGYATGAFAAAIGWLRTVAWPAVMTWWRTAAWPWLRGRPAAIWGWARTVAWPWIRTKTVAAYRWVKMRPLWGQLRGFYSVPNLKALMFKGFHIGFAGGAVGSVISKLINRESFTITDIIIDGFIGGVSGAILGPIVIPTVALSWPVVGVIGLYGGAENFFAEGFKKNDWSAENFLLGLGISIFSTKLIGVFVENMVSRVVNSDHLEEMGTKTLEEGVKWIYEQTTELIDGNDGETPSNSKENNVPETNKSSNESPKTDNMKGENNSGKAEGNMDENNSSQKPAHDENIQGQNNKLNPNVQPEFN